MTWMDGWMDGWNVDGADIQDICSHVCDAHMCMHCVHVCCCAVSVRAVRPCCFQICRVIVAYSPACGCTCDAPTTRDGQTFAFTRYTTCTEPGHMHGGAGARGHGGACARAGTRRSNTWEREQEQRPEAQY
jgi:hypothetical protein